MRKSTCLAALILCVALPALAADDNQVWPSEVTIQNTRMIKFISAVNGEPFAVSVSIPLIPPPKTGFPVYYVLDGEAYFSTAANFSVILQNHAAVVVGIGHEALNDKAVILRYAGRKPGDNSPIGMRDIGRAFDTLRNHDLTPPLAPGHRAPAWFDPSTGGDVDAFLRVIETEIKPKVQTLASIDKANQALFGHSFGGLAVVRALFTEPTAFRSFIASSPSLWFDADAVLKEEAAFSAQVTAGKIAPRVLITNGAREDEDGTAPDIVARLSPDRAAEYTAFAKMRAQWGEMIPLAHGLADRLAALELFRNEVNHWGIHGGFGMGDSPDRQ
jgi:uncharacterized protein